MDIDPDFLVDMSRQTGLTRDTCKDLLSSGWLYSSEIGKPDKWEKQF